MTTKPEDSPAVPVVAIPAGWEIMRGDNKPFQAISIKAPNGYSSIVYSHARNPENLLYMLADALLTQPESDHLAVIASLQERYEKLKQLVLDCIDERDKKIHALQAKIDALMPGGCGQLPKLIVHLDDSMPAGTMEISQDGKILGRLVNVLATKDTPQ